MVKRVLWGILLLIALGGVIYTQTQQKENQKNTTPIVLSDDDVAVVKKEKFSIRIAVSGELYPLNQTTVIARVGAQTQEVFVREGEAVKKDQVLAELNTADLTQILAERKAALSSAQASYKFSTAAVERYKKLLAKHFYSENDYDTAVHQLEVNQANVKQAEAAESEAVLQLQYAHIVSPLDGIVSERDVDPGMQVAVGQTLFKIVNLDDLELRAVVPADEISRVVVGQAVTFHVEGMVDDFSGELVRINPSNVAGTRAYYAYIHVKNADHRLKNGMFAMGHIFVEEQQDALIIPLSAVHKQNNQPIVYVIDHNKQVQEKNVVMGLVDKADNKVQILQGLQENERVIVSAIELKRGDYVT